RLFGLLIAGLNLGSFERLLVRDETSGYSIIAMEGLDREHRERLARSKRIGVALDRDVLEHITEYVVRGTVQGLFEVNHLDIRGIGLESGEERGLTIMGFPTGPLRTNAGLMQEYGD